MKARCFKRAHVPGCCMGRPACKARRIEARQLVCDCPAYPFPHRAGAGKCNPEARNEAAWGPAVAA